MASGERYVGIDLDIETKDVTIRMDKESAHELALVMHSVRDQGSRLTPQMQYLRDLLDMRLVHPPTRKKL